MIPTGDVEELTQAMIQIHDDADLAEKGRRSRELAKPYSAEEWAIRLERMLGGVRS
jgi:hypothetical protein